MSFLIGVTPLMVILICIQRLEICDYKSILANLSYLASHEPQVLTLSEGGCLAVEKQSKKNQVAHHLSDFECFHSKTIRNRTVFS